MDELFSLAGRIALVTGGAGGVGRMIAEGLLAQGARVYLAGRSAERCAEASAALGGAAAGCLPLAADVSSRQGRARLARQLGRREGRLDILVNNAGVGRATPFGSAREADWDEMLSVNLKAPFFLTQALVGLLRAAARAGGRPARVINIASVDGFGVNAAETYAYQASKAGLIQLTRTLALRLIAEGVVVSGVAPGAFPSDMNLAARDRPGEFANWIPARRVGDAADIAGAVVFLAARSGEYVIGETLAVDGGCIRAAATHGMRWSEPPAQPAARVSL